MTIATRLVRPSFLSAVLSAVSSVAAADPVAAPVSGSDAAPVSSPRHGAGDKGVFVTLKVGGLVPFSALGANATGGLDVGYALANGFAFGLAADYAQPTAEGSEVDARVAGGTYAWKLTEQLVQVMPFALYRLRTLGALVPYAGIGPRMYLQRSTVKGVAPAFGETTEQATAFGVGVPLGAEFALGPGAATAELLLQYGGLDHTITGTSNSGAASLALGYRMMF